MQWYLAGHGFGDGVLYDTDDGREAASAAALDRVRQPAVLRDLSRRQRGHWKLKIAIRKHSLKNTTVPTYLAKYLLLEWSILGLYSRAKLASRFKMFTVL